MAILYQATFTTDSDGYSSDIPNIVSNIIQYGEIDETDYTFSFNDGISAKVVYNNMNYIFGYGNIDNQSYYFSFGEDTIYFDEENNVQNASEGYRYENASFEIIIENSTTSGEGFLSKTGLQYFWNKLKTYFIGDLSLLTTTDKTSLVNALNEVYEKSGEPFRVKNWTGSWADGVTIPVCTKNISNTQIAKMTFSIDAVEGADYQIVGMIAYEVFDAVSGGNRLNVWPVCQFTGNGQKELSVRWVCMGTSDKLAKRINAWVLLKHR